MTPAELPDADLAAIIASLRDQRGGCLGVRYQRALALRDLVAERDRRECERCWDLPSAEVTR